MLAVKEAADDCEGPAADNIEETTLFILLDDDEEAAFDEVFDWLIDTDPFDD